MRVEKTIDIVCVNCGKTFPKTLREYKRRIKQGHDRFFCDLSCNAFTRNKEHPSPGNAANLTANNRRDEFTQFRWFVLRGKYRGKRGRQYGCDLTVEYLKELWDQQNGICPFTGWKLILPQDASNWDNKNPRNASLDRIDNSMGYVKDNVRFIAVMANLARGTFSDDQVIDFCKAVVSNHL